MLSEMLSENTRYCAFEKYDTPPSGYSIAYFGQYIFILGDSLQLHSDD